MTKHDATSERVDGPTPNGGVASVAYFRDAEGRPTTKDRAASMEIHELDAEGRVVARTYMSKVKRDA